MSFPAIYEGECWMMHDDVYSKKKHDNPGNMVRTIRFDRPCIILTYTNTLVMVIPLTSKGENQEGKYPIQIEEGRCSYAILSQVTTIDKSRLRYQIGTVKKQVFDDIRSEFSELFENRNHKVTRNVRQIFNRIDIHRFYPFHVYRRVKDNYTFMVLRISLQEFVSIPIMSKRSVDANTISTICGSLIMDEIRKLPISFYYEETIDLGFEFRTSVREKIIKKINSDGYRFHIKDIPYKDHLEDMSKALYYFVGQKNYIHGRLVLLDIYNSSYFQMLFSKQPEKILPISLNTELDREYYDMIKTDILYHLNPSMCDIHCLSTLIEKKRYDLLDEYLKPYLKCLNLNNEHATKMFDGTKLIGKYKIPNIKWIWRYYKYKYKSTDKDK